MLQTGQAVGSSRDHDDFAALVAVPDRDAVAPPELAADAPVADVFEPVEIDAGEAVGDDGDVAVGDGGVGAAGDAVGFTVAAHLEEPLEADEGFYYRIATLAVAHGMAVVLHLFQQAEAIQFFGDGAAGVEALHAPVFAGQVGHVAVEADNVDDFQAVPLANLKVGNVVAGGYFQGAGAELRLDGFVADDGDGPVHDGQEGLLAHVGGVAGVFGMDGHAGVAEHGLRAGGGDGDVAPIFALRERENGVGQGIADVVELAVLFLVFHFQVGEGGGATGAPVDDALVAVDEALVVEVDEGGADGLGRARVKGEAQAGPVAGGAQPLVLLVDGVAVAGDPLPDALLELFAAQVVAVGSLLGQQALDDPLGSDAGVVFAGEPQGVVAAHTPPAGEGVLDGGGEGMAQVEFAGDVGRGHDDDEGLASCADLGGEVAGVLPVLVDALFYGGGFVGPGDFGGGVGGHRIFL